MTACRWRHRRSGFKTPIFLKKKKKEKKNNEINSDSVFGVATASGGFPWLSATNAEPSNTDWKVMLCEIQKKARREGEKNKATLFKIFARRKKGVGAREKNSQNMAAGGFCVSDCSSPPSSFMLPLPPVSPFLLHQHAHFVFPPRQAVVNVG